MKDETRAAINDLLDRVDDEPFNVMAVGADEYTDPDGEEPTEAEIRLTVEVELADQQNDYQIK